MFGFKAKVKGDKLIDKQFLKVAGRGSRSAAKAGLSKAMTIIARGIRAAIPPKAKSVKKAVGQRHAKGGKRGSLEFSAKVGLGVGKASKSKKERDPDKPGVGISKANVHWWELGTTNRKTRKGKSTGAMPKGPPVVRQGFDAKKTEALRAAIATTKKKIKEAAKKKSGKK